MFVKVNLSKKYTNLKPQKRYQHLTEIILPSFFPVQPEEVWPVERLAVVVSGVISFSISRPQFRGQTPPREASRRTERVHFCWWRAYVGLRRWWTQEVCCSNHISTVINQCIYIKQLLLLLLLLPPLLPASMLKQLDDSMAVSIKKRAFPLIPAVFLSTSVVFVSFRVVLLLLCSEWSDSCHYACHYAWFKCGHLSRRADQNQ